MADDVTFPWALLGGNGFSISGDYTMVSGTPVYAQVVASRDRQFDAVRFMMRNVTAVTSLFVSIYKITSANTLTRVMDLGNVKSQLSSASALQTVAMANPLDAVAGEMFYVGVLAVGGTMPIMSRSALVANDPNITTGTVPEYHQITAVGATGSLTGFSTTMTISSTAATNSAARIWAALGNYVADPTLPAFYLDTLNRINQAELTVPWGGSALVPSFGIYNSTMSPTPNALLGAYNYWNPALRSDDHYVQARLAADMATDVNRTIDLYLGVRQSVGITGPSVKLHINPQGTFRIVTVTSSWDNTGLVQRAVAPSPRTFALGDVVKLVCQGTLYTAFHNDVAIVSWIDGGGIQPTGSSYRRVNARSSPTLLPDLQLVDEFEAGDFGGGVQLIAPAMIPSTGGVFAPTVRRDTVLRPGAGHLVLTGHAPTLRTATVLRPGEGGALALPAALPATFPPGGASKIVLTGRPPTMTVTEPPISFDAASQGSATSGTGPAEELTFYGTHSASGTNRVVVLIALQTGAATNARTATFRYAGTTITDSTNAVLGLGSGSTQARRVRMAVLLNPPTGSQSWQVTMGHTQNTAMSAMAICLSYNGVGGFTFEEQMSAPYTDGGARTLAVSAPTGRKLVQAFAELSSAPMTAYNKVQRGSITVDANAPGSLLVGDANGGDTTFTATGTNNFWAAVSASLIPA